MTVMVYDGTGPRSIKPVDLLMVNGEGKYWEFSDPHLFAFETRQIIRRELEDTRRLLDSMASELADGHILYLTGGWTNKEDLEETRAENAGDARKRYYVSSRLGDQAREEKRRRWREIAIGRETTKNLAAVFKQEESKIEALEETHLDDFERTRTGRPPLRIAPAQVPRYRSLVDIDFCLRRFQYNDDSWGEWVIDVGSIDGWENFGTHALCENEGGTYFCELESTELKLLHKAVAA